MRCDEASVRAVTTVGAPTSLPELAQDKHAHRDKAGHAMTSVVVADPKNIATVAVGRSTALHDGG